MTRKEMTALGGASCLSHKHKSATGYFVSLGFEDTGYNGGGGRRAGHGGTCLCQCREEGAQGQVGGHPQPGLRSPQENTAATVS